MNEEDARPYYEEKEDREAREVRADERGEQATAYDEQREAREVRADERADDHGEAREKREVRADERAAQAVIDAASRFHRDRRMWLAAFLVLIAFNAYLFSQVKSEAARTCDENAEARAAVLGSIESDLRAAKVFARTSASPEVRRYHREDRLPKLRVARDELVIPTCG